MITITKAAQKIINQPISTIRGFATFMSKRPWIKDTPGQRKNSTLVLQKAISLEGTYNTDGTWDGRVSVIIELQKPLRVINRSRVMAGDNPRGVCRRCGCSMGDPCTRPGDQPGPVVCSWINSRQTLCSFCRNGYCDLNCYLDGKCGEPRGPLATTVKKCRAIVEATP